jgi:gliding motility-associated-like protein
VFLLFILLSISEIGFTQNLVKNPSFEDYTICPSSGGFENVKDWYGLPGGSYYYNSCADPGPGVGVPVNLWGYQSARTGNAYGSVVVYYMNYSIDWKGYLEGQFVNPLIRDSLYCVSYYVNLTNRSLGAIMNVDAFISDTLVHYPPDISGSEYITLPLPAQIRSQNIISDTLNWTRISGLYKAYGGEKYITIGNFTSRENTTKISFNFPGGLYITYYIDDVSVAPVGSELPNLGNDTVICRNNLPLHLAAPAGYDEYRWSNGATTRETHATDQGTYGVRCIINGCGEVYDEKKISFDTPQLELGKDTTICRGEKIILSAQEGFLKYNWSTGDTTQSIAVSTEGVYIMETLDHCGLQTDNIKVQVNTLPFGIIELGNDTTTCMFGSDVPVILNANVPLPNYLWSTGDTTWQITVNDRGLYRLSSNFRCGTVSDSIFVNECPPKIFLPNAFSPGNDGKNDVFRAVVVNTQVDCMIIYNRWGQKIFESNKPFPEWDGSINNEPAPIGLYEYLVYFSDAESGFEQKQKRGTVMLIR